MGIVDIAPWIVLAASICGLAFAMYNFSGLKNSLREQKKWRIFLLKSEKALWRI